MCGLGRYGHGPPRHDRARGRHLARGRAETPLPHLAEDDRFIEDFVREAKLASHLRHPNIIQIYELGRYHGIYFIAMELVRGVSLMSLMRLASKKNQLLPVNAVMSVMLELTDALDHAHTIVNSRGELLGLVHRDLTPSNLLVTDDGHVKIIDFGIAKACAASATDSGLARGKLGYISKRCAPAARRSRGPVLRRRHV
jgi:serine/threonine-protein kinase